MVIDTRDMISAALAAALALAAGAAQAHADEKGKERCYGIAKAGQNDCGNLGGSHACAGLAKVDNDPTEWKAVPIGTCRKLKGLSEKDAQAKARK